MDESRRHRSSGRGERNLQVGDDGDLDDMPPLQSQVRPGVRSSSPVADFHPDSAQSGRPGSLRPDRPSGLLSAGGGSAAAPSATGELDKPVYSSAVMSETPGQQQQHLRQTIVRQALHGSSSSRTSSSSRPGAAVVTSASATQSVPTSLARDTQQQAVRSPSGHAVASPARVLLPRPSAAQAPAPPLPVIPPAPVSRGAMHNAPRWQSIHLSAGPCAKCHMCSKQAAWAPRMYTHPQQWTSAQLQSLAMQRGVSGAQCVCRQCLLDLMALLATPGRIAGTATASSGGGAPPHAPGGGPVADTIQAALTRRARPGATNGAAVGAPKGGDPQRASHKRGRGTPMASESDGAASSDSSKGDDSDGDRTFRVGGKSAKRRQQPAARQVACAYPKCPEPARHHIGKRSHPAAATLLSLSWDVIKSSCDASGRLPLCNEHHQTINQLNGPSGKGYQTKSAVRDLVGSQFRAEDYGLAFSTSGSAHGGGGGVATGNSKSCSTGSGGRRGRKWRAIDTNTPFARALRSLPKAVDRPERTYCGLVRMPVTCLLPSSHDMSLDRDVPHLAPSLSAPPLPSPQPLHANTAATAAAATAAAATAAPQLAAEPDDVPIVQRLFKHRLHGCVPVDMATGESVPRVQLLYADKPAAPVPAAIRPVASPASSASSNPARRPAEKSSAAPPLPQQRASQSSAVRTSSASTSQLAASSAAPPTSGKQRLLAPAPPSLPSASSASQVQSMAPRMLEPSRAAAGASPAALSPPLRMPGAYPRPQHHQQQRSSYPPSQHPRPHHYPQYAAHGLPQAARPVPVRPIQPWHTASQAQRPHHPGHPRPAPGPGHGPPAAGQVAGPRPVSAPADSTTSSSSNYFVAGVQQHLDIPAQLTDLDIQRQEEKVRELHRKLRQATAR